MNSQLAVRATAAAAIAVSHHTSSLSCLAAIFLCDDVTYDVMLMRHAVLLSEINTGTLIDR